MPAKRNIIFMGTPAFAVPSLKALHEAGHAIVAVYTQPPRPAHRGQKETPSPVHEYAAQHGLPVFTPTTLKDESIQAEFRAHGAELAVVVAYGLLLPKAILAACARGCINVHPSLLPRWRGAAPLQRTVMAGDTKTGICIMQMDEGLDTGDVLLREEYPLSPDITTGQLHDDLAVKAGPLLLETLAQLDSLKPQKQSSDGVTYAAKISKDEARIDWNKPAAEVHNLIRGLSPHPGAYFIYQNENIKILESTIASGNAAPGSVLDAHLSIACSSGAIRPLIVQRPGKKPMSVEEMLRGHPIAAGTQL